MGEKYAVYTIDLRNHGLSPHDPVMNYHAMASDIEEFIDTHGLQDPVLIGHSMGGKAVMQFLTDYAGIASKAMILDISPGEYRARKSHLNILMAMKSVDVAAFSSRKEIMNAIEARIEDKRLQQFVMKNLQRSGKDLFSWKPNIDVILESLEDIFAGIDTPSSKPDIPIQFVRGALSDYILDKDEELIKKNRWSDLPVITIPGAGHWIHVDTPKEVLGVFFSFLE